MSGKRAVLITCSPQGAKVAIELTQAEAWSHCPVWLPERYHNADVNVYGYQNLTTLVQQLFNEYDCLVFFCACGIAVRMIAPFITNKYADPAVVVCDEGGNFVISLLSGHVGGANDYAAEIAQILEAQPVITTATDVQQVFAVDHWAMQQQLHIVEKNIVKEISARMLQSKPVGFYSDYPWQGQLPEGLQLDGCDWGICISAEHKQPFPHTLHLQPRNIVLGVGCRKGITMPQLEAGLQQFLQQNYIIEERICLLASIDLKQQETGLLQFARQKRLPLIFYSAQQLQQARGDFTPSDFVQQIAGVDNVCARSAALASEQGHLLVDKQKMNGITLAAYEKKVAISFTVEHK